MANIDFIVFDDEAGETINVSYDKNITLEAFMKDFLSKHTDYVTLDTNVYTFKLGLKVLNSPKWIHRQLGDIIPPGGKVTLIRKRDVHYSGPITFTDVSKNNILNRGFSPDAPDYRTIHKGINIYGICKTEKCIACQQKVISNYIKDKIDMTNEKFNFTCPMCKGIIQPKTVGFYLCQYHIYGQKIEGDRLVKFDNGYFEAKDPDHSNYFDEAENGETTFIQLIFEVTKYY